jgi:hypothetical protein
MRCKTIAEMKDRLRELEIEGPVNISVPNAADIMGITPQVLRFGIKQGKFPFAVGYKMEQNEFYINTVRFMKYMRAQDMCYFEQNAR